MSEVLPYKVGSEGKTDKPVANIPELSTTPKKDDENEVNQKNIKDLEDENDSKDKEESKDTDESKIKADDKKKDEITSFSFDQVNDDATELIELRGEGRYFGVTDPGAGTINAQQSLGPLCANCHKRGHIRAKCKTVVCHKCGVVGDHYETQCPTTMICSRCGEKGHMTSGCTSKTRKRQYCRDCDTFSHGEDTCPSIWRSYLTKPTDDTEESLVLPVIACYNCASDQHYGDECPETRTSRVPNFGSAFSGSNLPKKYRPMYFHRLESLKPSRRDFFGASNTGRIPPRPTPRGPSGAPRGPAANTPRGPRAAPTRSGYIGSVPAKPKNYNHNYNNNYNNNYSNNNKNYNNYSNNNYNNNSNNYNGSNYNNGNYNNGGNSRNFSAKPASKPSRSGLIESSKRKKQKNIRNLY